MSELIHSLSYAWLVLIVVVTLALLAQSAGLLVEGASGLAYRLGVPKVIVGATIVSLGTTSPEAAVSVMAAWAGKPGLALGNAVGSVIADTALIFGLCCALTAIPADAFVLRRQGWLQFGSAMLLALLCYGAWYISGDAAALNREVGVLLIALLVTYLVVSIRWSREYGASTQEPSSEVAVHSVGRSALMVTGGLVIVALSSHFLIEAVSELAVRLGLPKVVIAATVVALGTSLPELIVGLTAVRHGHPELLVGNVIGADILNVLFVIGASALAAPLPIIDHEASVPALFLLLHLPAMVFVLALFRLYIARAVRVGEFSRWMGGPLLATFAAYTVLQFIVGRG